MIKKFLNFEKNESLQRKNTRFLWTGILTVFLLFGGLACLWACLADSPHDSRLSSDKYSVSLFLSSNDQSVITSTVSKSQDLSKQSAASDSKQNPLSKVTSTSKNIATKDPSRSLKSSPKSLKSSLRYNIYPGRVCAIKKSILTFRVSGPLLKINVVPGQTVRKGEVLMQIDPRDYQIQVDLAQSRLDAARANLDAMQKGARPEDVALLRAKVDEAEATLTLAGKEFERAQKLVESKTISASEYDAANRTFTLASLARNSAKKELEKGLAGARLEDIHAAEAEIRGLETSLTAAKNSLSDTSLRAPYDGVITTKMIEEHEMVTTTPTYRTVLGIHDISKLKIEIYVPEREMIVGDLHPGKTVSVRFTVKRENSYKAQLSEIDTEPSEVGMTYKLTFVLDRPTDLPILPGMISEVALPESCGINNSSSLENSSTTPQTKLAQ